MTQLNSNMKKLWTTIESFKLHIIALAFVGFVMCFYGGSFLILIVVGEAFIMGVSAGTRVSNSKNFTQKMKVFFQVPEPTDLALTVPSVMVGGIMVVASLKYRVSNSILHLIEIRTIV